VAVAGVDADAQPARVPDLGEDRPEVPELSGEDRPLAGGVLEANAGGRGPGALLDPVQGLGHPGQARLDAGAHVRTGVGDHAGKAEGPSPPQLLEKSSARAFKESGVR